MASSKKKVKKLKKRVSQLEDTVVGSLWVIVNMISLFDSNMETITKTFKAVVDKINEMQDIKEEKDVEETDTNPSRD
ncbi:hypothetical protein LCGC14_0224260 [marine sediment metagenome]|uniref:Uncharacterized protein n=1 Tax=marine sediment metagenome TaxID=412755 RepID=A0A0F9XG28_9ZZZZ